MISLENIEYDRELRDLGFEVFYLRKTFSTMDYAKEALTYGGYLKAVIVTEEQIKGRGRKGRKWVSPKGGLWVTIVTPVPQSMLELISMIAGLSVVLTIKELYGLNVKLKWPNDIVYLGFKLGGILIENELHGSKVVSLIGIGLNCNNNSLSIGVPGAISLREILGRKISRIALLKGIIKNLVALLNNYLPHDIIQIYKSHSFTLNRKVKIFNGEKTIEGIAVDITANGKLVVKTYENNFITVEFGEIIEHEGLHYKPG